MIPGYQCPMQMILGLAVMLCLPAYLVAQVWALMRWPLRVSAVPLVVMGAALATTVAGFAQGSNLAPILLAPLCLAWLIVAYVIRR